MIILGIETSCDETAAAIVEQKNNRVLILSNTISSSASLQAKYGGIVPEQAAREQLKTIIPVIKEAISNSQLTINDIHSIAVTLGPGLIGSLLVGVETAKTLAVVWNKPLIPVNHLLAHFYACWIDTQLSVTKTDNRPTFPFLGLLVSGGHTDLLLFKNHHDYKHLGGTRDDAAGECFDKCARLLNLPYPGGPNLSKLAKKGDPKAFNLPKPMINSDDYDFSFSGLKTAVANLIQNNSEKLGMPEDQNFGLSDKSDLSSSLSPSESFRASLAASIEETIVNHLIHKTFKAAQDLKVKQIVVAGGVAANSRLRTNFQQAINDSRLTINLIFPPLNLCTDNAVTTAIRALFDSPKNPLKVQAIPNLRF